MRRLLVASLTVWVGLTGAVLAQSQSAVVVELFTSQGCSSCPPADDYLAGIADRDDVIALALHVDYWDYIGWKDTFGSHEFTNRQHRYAQAANARSVYTPQFVVGGADHVVGNGPSEVAALIRSHMAQNSGVSVSMDRSGGTVTITAETANALPDGAVVQLVHYLPEASVKIKRGENAGRSISYHNIVTAIEQIGTWDGKAAYHADVKAGDGPLVVLVQSSGMGPILAAARLR